MRKGLSASEAGKLGAIAAEKTIRNNKIKRIEEYNLNPKLCKQCKVAINYDKRENDFCSHSCAACFNNKGITRCKNKSNYCLNCKDKTYNKIFCSTKCQQDSYWKKRKENLLLTGKDTSSGNKTSKRYLIELYKGKCQICNLNEWQNKKIPLVLDHIDGNPYNNLLENLRVICNNCDAQLPTFKGKNKGNGRIKRRERYKEGKSY